MTLKVSTEQAASEFGSLLSKIAQGDEVIITQSGKPVALLSPIKKAHKVLPTFGSAKGLVHISDDFDLPVDDFQEYAS